jgi:hypothetical protein
MIMRFMFCRYLLELFLIDYRMIRYNPSLLAAASIYITLKITKKSDYEKLYQVAGYTEDRLRI